MDYKRPGKTFAVLFIPVFLIFFLAGCKDAAKSNTGNTFYIELVNFTHDSLRQSVADNIYGKVSYHKNDKLQIVSLNFVTEDYPDMHYFKNAEALEKEIEPGTKKIRIEFGGTYSIDSIRYSLQKFTYNNNQWVKTSDMGFIKATTTYKKARLFAIKEFTREIVYSAVTYTYN